MTALLAAMFAFSAKSTQDRDRKSAAHFSNLAMTCVDGAFVQCADEVPPLCLLQALILVTHWLILKGVRGRAWRYLGLCIRVAFELGLPSTDDGKDRTTYTEDIDAWCDDEERRRAYWAIREMDQHVNHLKHVPFPTDWTQNQVFLPAEDEKWFRGEPHLSCVASSDPLARAKTLQATGHKSARAWYIVLCSLVAEAWDLTYSTTKINQFRKWKSMVSSHESSNYRSSLLNALRLYVKMLPPELKFHGQLLDFGTQTSGRSRHPLIIHDHSWICLIALMTEAVRLTSHKPFVFEAYLQKTVKMAQNGTPGHGKQGEAPLSDENLSPKVELCYAASDAILNIFLACHETHYQYIHPYIAQSAWSSATVQLLRREMTENEFEKQVIRSKYEILKAISGRFVHYWEMSEVPKQNLDELDLRLKQFTTASQNVRHRARSPSVPSQSQTTTPQETSLEWNDSLMFDTSLGRPGTLNLPSSRPIYSPSTTAAVCREASTQTSSTTTRNELESNCPPIFFLGQDHDLEDPSCASFQEPESTVTPWQIDDLPQPQITNGLSEPLDWLSFFTNADLNGELSDCYEAFSGPFLS